MLLVDDSADEAAFVQRALAQGHPDVELTVCSEGPAAVAFLSDLAAAGNAAQLPALVLLDLKMPRVSGQTTLASLRERFSPGMLPIVIFTSSREPSDIIRAYGAGANSYLVKPLVFEEYVQLVTAAAHYWLNLNVRNA
jgi:two-component system response regulator